MRNNFPITNHKITEGYDGKKKSVTKTEVIEYNDGNNGTKRVTKTIITNSNCDFPEDDFGDFNSTFIKPL